MLIFPPLPPLILPRLTLGPQGYSRQGTAVQAVQAVASTKRSDLCAETEIPAGTDSACCGRGVDVPKNSPVLAEQGR